MPQPQPQPLQADDQRGSNRVPPRYHSAQSQMTSPTLQHMTVRADALRCGQLRLPTRPQRRRLRLSPARMPTSWRLQREALL